MTANKQPRGRISWITLSTPNTTLVLAVAFVTAVVTMPAQAQFKVLYTFTGGADGGTPQGSVIEDAKGNLYGTTQVGGNLTCNSGNGCGVVYKLTPAGKETVLHSFAGGADGAFPYAALLMDAVGNLYGTTQVGGGASGCFGSGCGTVFKISPKGKETVLYRFQGKTDGGLPYSTLIMDKAGNFYGVTSAGGNLSCTIGFLGCGTVFKLTKTGKETILYSFTGGKDGAYPGSSLYLDSNGNFYGTTSQGGDLSCNAPNGCGTVFKLAKTGKETVLHAFTGATDGASPFSGLDTFDHVKLWGTTNAAGDYGGGTLWFWETYGGKYKSEHSFGNIKILDGAYPFAGVSFDGKGNVFGVTELGGAQGYGTLFELSKAGKESVRFSFDGAVNGAVPSARLLYDPVRLKMIGTASQAGSTQHGPAFGVVFSYKVQ